MRDNIAKLRLDERREPRDESVGVDLVLRKRLNRRSKVVEEGTVSGGGTDLDAGSDRTHRSGWSAEGVLRVDWRRTGRRAEEERGRGGLEALKSGEEGSFGALVGVGDEGREVVGRVAAKVGGGEEELNSSCERIDEVVVVGLRAEGGEVDFEAVELVGQYVLQDSEREVVLFILLLLLAAVPGELNDASVVADGEGSEGDRFAVVEDVASLLSKGVSA
jgi:hypothetical protein